MARKAPFKLKQLWESRFPPRIPAVSFYAYYTTEIIKDNSKFLMQIDSVSVKFSSVIHLTVDDYYLRGFGFISISV